MKEKIITWATTDRSFDTGLQLLSMYSKLTGVIRKLNIQGATPGNIQLLHYHLMKLAGASEAQWRRLMGKSVSTIVTVDLNNPAQRSLAIAEIPEEVRNVFRLRDEFPFLREKECPNELKILVADMLTTHDAYVRDHEALFATLNPEEISALSQSVVENYLENRLIWDELNHYKQTGKPLAQHPVWKRGEQLEELKKLSNADLVKLSKNIPTNISRIRKKLAEEPGHPETQSRTESLENYLWKLEQVNKLLGLDG